MKNNVRTYVYMIRTVNIHVRVDVDNNHTPLCDRYTHFKWEDYLSRRAMSATFENRHYPYTNGSKNLRGIMNKNNWKNGPGRVRQLKPKKKRKPRLQSPSDAEAEVEADNTAQWDSETGEWVEDD